MNETPETLHETPQPKKAWHAPAIEETSYTATELAGPPGAVFDGYAAYSVA